MARKVLVFFLFAGLFAPQWGNEAADLQVCIDGFVVHADKIIRTQDSRALGAKYLSEAEVASREDCLQLCCETLSCDVFVYEHKRRGSCYLFHCGGPQDFKCKFTQHRNYSSGVLMPSSELENQIKLTKHEEELAQLSKKTESVISIAAAETTAPPIATTVKVPQPTKANATTRSECSRYQFECRSTRECIAIYNACDGIPQCPDGSDEGPELDCPTIAGTVHPGQPTLRKQPLPLSNDVRTTADVKKSYPQPPPAPYPSYESNDKQESLQALEAQQQLMNQVKAYGREGEAAPEPPNGWRAYMGQPRKPADEPSRIFSHKGGLVAEGDRYNFHHHFSSNVNDGLPMVQYGNEVGHGEYTKGAGPANGYYGGNPYPPYNWPPRQRDDPRWMYPGPPPPADYYYEEAQMRARLPPSQTEQHAPPPPPSVPEPEETPPAAKPVPQTLPSKAAETEKTTLTKVEEGKTKGKETTSVKKLISESESHHKAAAPTHAPSTQNMVMNEDDVVILDADGENERPRGAILSLALGMCIAAIMITLVGCRLRVVQRRLRRGKAGYAHDADFLVNGMYL